MPIKPSMSGLIQLHSHTLTSVFITFTQSTRLFAAAFLHNRLGKYSFIRRIFSNSVCDLLTTLHDFTRRIIGFTQEAHT